MARDASAPAGSGWRGRFPCGDFSGDTRNLADCQNPSQASSSLQQTIILRSLRGRSDPDELAFTDRGERFEQLWDQRSQSLDAVVEREHQDHTEPETGEVLLMNEIPIYRHEHVEL